MPKVPFNRDKVDTEFTPLDTGGPYEIECIKCEPGVSQTGNPKLDLEYQCISGPDQKSGFDVQGRHLFDHVSATDDGRAFSLANILDAFGIPNDKNGFNTEDFIGATCRVTVKHEEYEGKMRDRIDTYE